MFHQDIDRVAVGFCHALRKTCRHYRLSMMGGIQPDHVQQVSRSHRPAELFFHHGINIAEIRTVTQ
ncbi:hypothetical protein OS12_42010 [Dickeya oryzae]